MRVVYNNFPIYNSDGSVAGHLDGEYEAKPNVGQQPGWYALHPVLPDGTVEDNASANFNMIGMI